MIENENILLTDDQKFIINEPIEFYNDKKDFTSLIAWKKCREAKIFIYKKILPCLPKEEKFNLDIQIRKACISTTANISEGYGRYHYQEGIQFYRIARASLYELKDHLISCFDLSFINIEVMNEGEQLLEEAKKTLNGYINFVRSKIK